MISAKQKVVLRLIVQGESDESVRAELNLDQEDFRKCLDQLCRRLGVTSRVELIFFACSEEGRRLLEEEAA